MAGVNMPQRREGLLDTVMKGLSIARDVYGIKADMAKSDAEEAQQKHAEETAAAQKAESDRIASAKLNKGEQVSLFQKGFAEVPEGTKGAFSFLDAEKPGLVHYVAKLEKPAIAPPENKAAADRLAFDREKFDYSKKHDAMTASAKETPKPATPDQFKAGLFAKRMFQAENVFSDLEKDGFDRTSNMAGLASYVPGAFQPDNVKKQEQAERNFMNAVLRRESGSAIGKEEFKNGELQYFPRAGDSSDLVEQKRQNRALAIQGMNAEAGSALAQINLPEKKAPKPRPGEAVAAPSGKVDPKIQAYAKDHGLDYSTARGVLTGRGYAPNE